MAPKLDSIVMDPEFVWMTDRVQQLFRKANTAINTIGGIKNTLMALHRQRKEVECKRDRAREKRDEGIVIHQMEKAREFLKEWGLEWDAIHNQPFPRRAADPKLKTVEEMIEAKERESKICREVITRRYEEYVSVVGKLEVVEAVLKTVSDARDEWKETAEIREHKLQELKQQEPKWKRAEEKIRMLEATMKDKDRAYANLQKKHVDTESECARLVKELEDIKALHTARCVRAVDGGSKQPTYSSPGGDIFKMVMSDGAESHKSAFGEASDEADGIGGEIEGSKSVVSGDDSSENILIGDIANGKLELR